MIAVSYPPVMRLLLNNQGALERLFHAYSVRVSPLVLPGPSPGLVGFQFCAAACLQRPDPAS